MSDTTTRKNFASIEERFQYVIQHIPEDRLDKHTLSATFGLTPATASNIMTQFRNAGLVDKKKRERYGRPDSVVENTRPAKAIRVEMVPKELFGFPDKVGWTKIKCNEDRARDIASASAIGISAKGWKAS